MAISIDKILTISAQDYVGPAVKVGDRYDVVGVHDNLILYGESLGGDANEDFKRIGFHIERLANIAPKGTEVIVNLERQLSTSDSDNYVVILVSGTALIPKQSRKLSDADLDTSHYA